MWRAAASAAVDAAAARTVVVVCSLTHTSARTYTHTLTHAESHKYTHSHTRAHARVIVLTHNYDVFLFVILFFCIFVFFLFYMRSAAWHLYFLFRNEKLLLRL